MLDNNDSTAYFPNTNEPLHQPPPPPLAVQLFIFLSFTTSMHLVHRIIQTVFLLEHYEEIITT